MRIKKIFLFGVVILSGIVLLQRAHADNDRTLPQQATVPTTQSTVDMDSKGESYDEFEGLLAPKLDMSNPMHRQKLLANFESERKILKKKGLSEDDLKGLKDAIINGDVEEIKRVYWMENGGKQ